MHASMHFMHCFNTIYAAFVASTTTIRSCSQKISIDVNMAAKENSARSPSGSMTKTDTELPPPPPQKYSLVLKLGWSQMKTFFLRLNPADYMQQLKSERKALKKKLQKGKDLTQSEIEILNASSKEMLGTIFTDFQTSIVNSLEIKEDDDKKVKLAKIQLAKEIMQWLKNLETWLTKQLADIFDNELVTDDMIMQKTEVFVNQLTNAMKPETLNDLFVKLQSSVMDDKSSNDDQPSVPNPKKFNAEV